MSDPKDMKPSGSGNGTDGLSAPPDLSAREMQQALASLPHGIWRSVPDGRVDYVNPVLCSMMGMTREQMLGWGWLDMIHPDDREMILDRWAKNGGKTRPLAIESRMRVADGTYRWHRTFFSPGFDDEGAIECYFGTVTDIHEQKLTQAELYLKSDAIEHSLNAFDIISSEGKFLYANRAYLEMWGFDSMSEIVGTSPVGHCADPTVPERIIGELKANGECRIEFKGKRRDGSTFDVLMWARRAHDPDGNDIFTGTSFDVTKQKRADAALKESKEEAERANQLKSAFLANMSHEIRTPLGVMLGYTDLLKDPGLAPWDRRSYVETLARNGRQLLSLVDDILDLSKIEADRLTIEIMPMSPAKTVQEIVRLLAVKAREQGLNLEYIEETDTPAEIKTDPTRLRQVLMNVATNALKFTERGGVKIRSYGARSPVGLNIACFEISDTGIGIAETERERIFDMFVQADGSITRRFGGTGLGLPLSRKLARALGGDLVLKESTPGVGSTFVATFIDIPELPVAPVPLEPKVGLRPSEQETPEALAGIRVLSVDDSTDNQTLVRYLLTRHGAQVEVADNGLEGLEKALSGDFDVILMDIQMPVMDGFTATRRLRENGYLGPIIALTAHASAENRQKCLDAGCSDFMSKPIVSPQLVSRIRQWSGRNISSGEFALRSGF